MSAGVSFGADLAAMVGSSREFFGLEPEEKAQVRWSGTGEWVGWQPLYEGGADALLLERYELALPDPAGFASDAEWAAAFPLWSRDPVTMAESWAAYYRTARAVTTRIVEMIAEAVGLPAADLPAWTTRQHSTMSWPANARRTRCPDETAPGAVRDEAANKPEMLSADRLRGIGTGRAVIHSPPIVPTSVDLPGNR